MAHVSRPLHTGRAFAPHYPTRESDGPAHVGVLLDLRRLQITQARDSATTFLKQARAARLAGDDAMWSWHMSHAAAWVRQALTQGQER